MKRYYFFVEILFIFFLSMTPLLWLPNGQIVLGHDSGFRLVPWEYLGDIWYSWNPFVGFGADTSMIKGFLVAQLPEAIFTKLTGSLTAGQTMSFMYWFFVMGLSMWLCLRNFFGERKFWAVRLIASTWYMYNFFLLQGWFITERAKFSLFAALPLLVMICWNTFVKRYSVIFGSVLFAGTLLLFNGGGSPPLYGGILVTLGVIVTFFIVRSALRKSFRDIFYILKSITLFGFMTVLFNAYWIFPQAFVGLQHYSAQLSTSGGLAGILSWEASVNKFASLTNLLRLQGIPDWYDSPYHPYSQKYLTSPTLILASFIPMAAILFVLLKKKLWEEYGKERQFLFVTLLVFLSGLVMTAGSHPPFGFIYALLLRYIPGFAMFRSAFYKFGLSVWFSTIVLSSFALYTLVSHYLRPKVLYVASVIAIIVGILFYHFPYFTGVFFEWSRPFSTRVTLPAYAKDMFSYINTRYAEAQPSVMLLPPLDNAFHADSYAWNFWSLDALARLGLRVPVMANDIQSPIIDAIYNAAVAKNTDLFYRLARQIGIKKILWRGDILYADKKTTSSNFAYMRDDLLASPGITKEKTIGEWTLYNIENSTSGNELIHIVPSVYRADVDTKHPALFENVDTGDTPFVLGGSLHSKNLEVNIGQFLQGNVLEPQCVLCNMNEQQQLANMATVQSVRFLPDSPFYIIVARKEQNLLGSLEKFPERRVDADLGLATKRLVEVSGLISRDIKDNTDSLALKAFQRFQDHIEDAILLTEQFSEIERNASRTKIISYLKFYTKYLTALDEKNVLPKDFITTQYEYLQEKNNEISKQLWITESIDNSKYYLNTPWEGDYQLYVSPNRGTPRVLIVDGEIVDKRDNVHFKEGIHRLVLHFDQNNALSKVGSISADITLQYGKEKTFEAPLISYQDPYLLQFNYRVIRGRNVYVSVHQDNDAKDKTGNTKRTLVVPLMDDGIWHSANYIISPNFAATRVEIVFFAADTSEKESALSISQLTLQNTNPANVFAVRRNALAADKMPTLSFRKINPSLYEVSMKSVRHPYILHFQQAFNKGWGAFIMPTGQTTSFAKVWQLIRLLFLQPEDTERHFALNGYTNAWYVNRTGDYTMVLVYWPYIIFLVSGVVSGLSVILGFFFIGVTQIRRYRHA